MKRLSEYLLTAILLMAACGVRAQTMSSGELFPEDAKRRRTPVKTEWNIYAGALFAGWSSSAPDMKFDTKVGYHAAFDIALLFGSHYALVPELRFSHTAVNITGTAGNIARIKSNGLELPLMFEYRLLRGRLRFQAGPSFTLMDSNEYSYRGEDIGGMRLRPTVTYVVGVRGVLGRRVSVGVRYNGQFNRTEQIMGLDVQEPDYETYRLGSYRVSVSVGYRF